jgi:hypothetical protein
MKNCLWRVNSLNTDIVQKKSPWLHYNTRILKLFNDRLEYIDPKTNILKGTIRLDSFCKAINNNEGAFDIVTRSRTFIFKVIQINVS